MCYQPLSERSSATLDELKLVDRESYFVVLKVTNDLGYVTMLHSNGVTVKLEPLLPGIVRDGEIPGIDLQYQTSKETLSANWDSFGITRKDGSFEESMYGKKLIFVKYYFWPKLQKKMNFRIDLVYASVCSIQNALYKIVKST